MQQVIEEGVMQRNCIISLGQREAKTEALGGRIKLLQRPGGLTQLAKGADLSVLGLCKAKWLISSVARA